MLYEIKTHEAFEALNVGATYDKSYITSNYEVVNVKKGHCLKFKEDGKKSATYVLIERKSYHTEFEVIVTEATTGRRIEVFK